MLTPIKYFVVGLYELDSASWMLMIKGASVEKGRSRFLCNHLPLVKIRLGKTLLSRSSYSDATSEAVDSFTS